MYLLIYFSGAFVAHIFDLSEIIIGKVGYFMNILITAARHRIRYPDRQRKYAEGNILSERMSRIGLGYYFVPSVSVIHDNGTTTSRHIGPDTALLMAESNAYYYI